MALDQKRLEHLLAIARTGSFGAAAAALGVSQPALSTSIALLEKAVGGAVLARDRRGAKLTALGEILAEHARTLEFVLGRAATQAKLFLEEVQGPLAIGASPVAAASFVPQAVLRIKEELPRLAVSIIEGVDDDLIARLTMREIDLLISPIGGARLPPDIEETPLIRGPMTVIMRPANPLARHRSLTIKQLMRAEWVLPMAGNVLRRRFEALFLFAGMPIPAHTIATNSISAVKALVRQSNRIAFMARPMAEPELASGALVALPIADDRFRQTLSLKQCAHPLASPMAEKFKGILCELARDAARLPLSERRGPARRQRTVRAALKM